MRRFDLDTCLMYAALVGVAAMPIAILIGQYIDRLELKG